MVKKLLFKVFAFWALILTSAVGWGQCPTSVSISADPGTTICAGTDVTFTANPSGGTTYTYQWYLNGTELSGQNNKTYTSGSLSNSDKIKVIVSSGSCTVVEKEVSMTVNATASVSFNIQADKSSVCEGNPVTFSAGAITNGGTSPSYQWIKNGSPISGATSATYTTADLTSTDKFALEVISSAQCANPLPATSNNELSITVNPLPTLTTNNGSVCASGQSSIDLNTLINGSGTNYTFYQSESNAINKTGAINAIVTPTSQTTYYVRSELSTGCYVTGSIIISIDDLPAVDAGSDQAICPGESFDLSSIGSGSNRSFHTSQTDANSGNNPLSSPVVSPTAETTYYVRSENTAGCYNTDSVKISINSLPNLSTSNGSVCADGQTSIDLNSLVSTNGTATFYTSQENADTKSNGIDPTVSPTSQTTYYVRSELGTGCFSTDSITISIDVLPTISVVTGSVCATGQTSIDLKTLVSSNSTNISFYTSEPNATSGSNAINSVVSPTAETTYYVRSENSQGCYDTAAVLVKIDSLPTVDAGGDQEICVGSYFDLSSISSGNGTLSYYTSLTNAENKNSPLSSPTVSPAATTEYFVRSESTAGCFSVDSVIITVNPDATISLTSSNNNQTLCVNTSITAINYSIGGGGTGANVSGLPSGVGFSYNSGTKVLTLSGTPTASGTFNYEITTTGCGSAKATGTIIVDSPITSLTPVFEKDDDTDNSTAICPVVSGLVYRVQPISGATSYLWTFPTGWTATTGTISNGVVITTSNTVTVNVTSSAATGNKAITVKGKNACGESKQTSFPVTVNTFTYADAGPDQFICKNTSSVQLNGEVGGAIGNHNDYNWSDNGVGGSFTWTGNQKLNATYTLPNSIKTNGGTIKINLTTIKPSKSSCQAATDEMVITVLKDATITTASNKDPIVCINTAIETISFNIGEAGTGATATGLPAGVTGIFDAGVFSISGTPTASGTFNYTVNTTGNCTNQTSITGTIQVDAETIADAGADLIACQSSDPSPITLTDASISGGATTGAWSITSGGGSLSSTAHSADPSSVTYTPAVDFTGEIELTLTSNAPGECAATTDTRKIIIEPAPTVEAGEALTICQSSSPSPLTLGGATFGGGATTAAWSITSGGGTLSNSAHTSNPQNVTYTPAADYFGEVILTLTTDAPGTCSEVLDTKIITIDPVPIVDAGEPDTVCQSSAPQPVSLTGASVGGGGSTAAWSITSGGGTLSSTSQTANPETVTYTPAVNFTGTVILTLTTNTPGICTAVTDTREITVEPAPTVDAGNDITICETASAEAIPLSEAKIGGGASTGAWSIVSGEGTLSNTTHTGSPENITFTPAEGYTGEIILSLITNALATCEAVEDALKITINPAATLNAGEDQTICSSETATMTASLGGGATSGTWTSSGSGTFSNNTTTAVYTPSSNDISSGSVTLTYTSNNPDGPCEAVTDSMMLTIKEEIQITTQPQNVGVCVTSPASLSVVAYGDDLTYQWYKGTAPGTAIEGATSSTLEFGQTTLNDDGTYFVVVGDDSTCSAVTSHEVTLNVNEDISIETQPISQVICEEESYTFNVVAKGSIESYQWRKNGTPIDGAVNSSFTIDIAAVSDSDSYDVVIYGTGGTCNEAYSSAAVLTVNSKPADPTSASSSVEDNTICAGDSTVLTLIGGGGGSGEEIKWYTDDQGENLAGTGNNITVSPSETTTYYGRYETSAPCSTNSAFAEVTVTVNFDSTIALSEGSGSNEQTICINNDLTSISYDLGGGATGASITEGNLPEGVTSELTGESPNQKFVISGIPTEAGTFNYAVTTSGPCENVSLTGTIEVNPAPAVAIAAEEQSLEICYDGTAYNITAGASAENTASIEWSVPEGSGTIANANSLTDATFTPAEGIDEVVITLSGYGLSGCSNPAEASITVTIQPLPTVTEITYEGGVEFCDNEDSPAPVISGTHAYEGGEFSWSPAAGEPASNELNIDTATGAISAGSDPGVYDITYSTPTGAICGVIEKTISITISKLPDATFDYSAAAYCQSSGGNPAPNITGDTGGEFSASTGLVIDENGVINVAASTANDPNDESDVHTITYTFVSNGICEEVSTTVEVRIDAAPEGGILSFNKNSEEYGRLFTTCEITERNQGLIADLVLKDHFGKIEAWQYKTASGTVNTITNNEGTNFTGSTLTGAMIEGLKLSETTVFQVHISSGACTSNSVVSSQSAILSVISSNIEPTPVTADKEVICLGDPVILTAGSGYEAGTEIGDGGNFDNSSITNHGWTIINHDGTQGKFDSSADNGRAANWLRTNPLDLWTANINDPNDLSLVRYDSDIGNEGNKGIAVVSGGHTGSKLITPEFSITEMDQAILKFDQAYNLTEDASIVVEITKDGGKTWEQLYIKTGPAKSGHANDFGGEDKNSRPENKIEIDLGAYMGYNKLQIRWHYKGINNGDVWAVDGISIPDGPAGVGMVWKDHTGETSVIIGTNYTETWYPTEIGWNISDITTTLEYSNGSCETAVHSEELRVFAFDSYSTTVNAELGSCGNNSAILSATATGQVGGPVNSYPTKDGYKGRWNITGSNDFTLKNIDPEDDQDPQFNPQVLFTGDETQSYNIVWELVPTAEDANENLLVNTCPPQPQSLALNFTPCTALDFDGVDDYVDLGEGYTGDYSIEAWIRPEASTGTIISTPQLEINMEDLPTNIIANDRWYHIAVDSNGKLYVDGIDVNVNISKSGTSRAFIGARWNAPNPENHFTGWIEEVRIWNGSISQKNIQFTMNQRLKKDGNIGVVVDMAHPDAPVYSNLAGYYQLLADPAVIKNGGYTPDLAGSSVDGKLRNMETFQENTAPLPYFSANDGLWETDGTWARPEVWDPPHSNGINDIPIEWNIVRTSHNIKSNKRDIKVLGLLSEVGTLDMEGANPTAWSGAGGTGNELFISHYLLLNGIIDLNGESQLVQPMGSVVDPTSGGYLDRDQQGTASSYNYNYWISPVGPDGSNSAYSVGAVMMDGSTSTPQSLDFGAAYAHADGGPATPRKVSAYWLHKFHGTANDYFKWVHIGNTGTMNAGEGYSMKGTAGTAGILESQNYTFRGLPNNGDITPGSTGPEQNYLIGNPYPSAIDANKFIKDNLNVVGGGNTNVFNGTIYFWSHFANKTHYLQEYIGGYAAYNLGGGVKAVAIDERINATDDEGGQEPRQFIPVGQAFFINTVLDETLEAAMEAAGLPGVNGGQVIFQNSQRIFVPESNGDDGQSVFHSQERKDVVFGEDNTSEDVEQKRIWLKFKSPKGYHRQILVTADPNATDNFDLGYDAPLIENNVEDMYWYFSNYQFVIQGVPDFNIERVLDLGIKVKEKGTFKISIDDLKNIPDEMNIFLADSLLQVVHDLRVEPYEAESEAGVFTDRFKLVFQDKTPQIEPEEPVIIEEGPFELLYVTGTRNILLRNPELLEVDRVYLNNMLGQQVHVYYNVPLEREVELPVKRFSAGVYIVKVHYEGGIMTKKVILE